MRHTDSRQARSSVLLLIPSSSYRANDFMDAASRLDVEVLVGIDKEPALSPSESSMVTLDFDDPDRAAEVIRDFSTDTELSAVIAVDDVGTLVAAKASRLLEIPYNSVQSVEFTRDKYALRNMLATTDLPTPTYSLIPVGLNEDELALYIENIVFPVVLKPRNLSASQGVIRADDPTDFVAAYDEISTILSSDPSMINCSQEFRETILIEEYIPGEEYALEGLLDEGNLKTLALFDKPDPLTGPYFEETIYVTPSRLPVDMQLQVQATVQSACKILGLSHGPIHAEVRLNETRCYVIDLAARSIGGLCARTLSFGSGLGLEEILISHSVGAAIETKGDAEGASGVMMIPIPSRGTYMGVQGLDRARAVEGIEEVTMSVAKGDSLVPLPRGNEYLGFIFSRAANPEAAEEALRQAHAFLEFDIE